MKQFLKLYYKLHKGFVQLCVLLLVLGIYIASCVDGEQTWLVIFIAIGMQALHFLLSFYEYISDDDNFIL